MIIDVVEIEARIRGIEDKEKVDDVACTPLYSGFLFLLSFTIPMMSHIRSGTHTTTL